MGQSYSNQLLARQLSVADQAEVLRIVHGCPTAVALSKSLGEQLQNLATPAWITSADLAEVFAVVDALHYYNPDAIDGAVMAAIAKRLVASETSVGGPYAEDGEPPRVLANAYIANCMGWLAAPLPNVQLFLQRQHALGRLGLLEATVLARSQPELATQVIQGLPSSFKTALASYYVVAQHTAAAPQHQLEAPSLDDNAQLLALAIFADQQPKAQSQSKIDNRHRSVTELAKPTYESLPEPLRSQALKVFDCLVQVDSEYEIRLLSHYFADAYLGKPTATEFLNYLGVANIHTWLAYTIYDDFFDNEGQPPLLSVANVAMRAAADTYRRILPKNPAFQAYVDAAFTAIDAANNWETLHWRCNVSQHSITIGNLPNYGNRQLLADRALLHIMGPLAVITAHGKSVGGKEWQACLEALRHYLIARQLTDDLHDWAHDLRAGRISYVVAEILQGLALPKGTYQFSQLLPMAQRHFWQHALPDLCHITLGHINQAREGLLPYVRTDDNQLFRFFDHLEASVTTAMAERKQGQDFLHGLGDHTTSSNSDL